jgi:hypothetical protein
MLSFRDWLVWDGRGGGRRSVDGEGVRRQGRGCDIMSRLLLSSAGCEIGKHLT